MADLRWSWLATPYFFAAVMIISVAVAAALIRGDRVLRLGVIAASSSAIPWALCQGLAACTTDPDFARQLIRIGQGPVAAVGPNLLLVLLGVSGQLERHKWIARIAAFVGAVFFMLCWSTDLVVPAVQVVPAGMFYMDPGPLTGVFLSQLMFWMFVGLFIVRRSAPRAERKRTVRLLIFVFAVAAVGSLDTLLLYRIWGIYPIAWFGASVAAGVALYIVLRTDALRPQGFDRGVAIELVMLLVTSIVIAGFALVFGTYNGLPLVLLSAIVYTIATGISWGFSRARPTRIKGERELDQFVARVPSFDDEKKIREKLAALWKKAVAIDVEAMWWRDGNALVKNDGTRWEIDPDVVAWLVQNPEPLALLDLATMRLGPLRQKIEALGVVHGEIDMLVPLVDREELVGLVEARHSQALRESERALVADSARAAARALTFVDLARAASRERETAREVEVADALRLQASASRETELGRWAVSAEYRTAPRTTGAGWSATELIDGRLALLVTEAQAHGVAAALATAALTGAFAAATSGQAAVTLDMLLRTMRASSEGVLRGGEPVAAFLAIVDAHNQRMDWACAGHPGAFLIGPIASIDSGTPAGSLTGPRPKTISLSFGRRIKGASLTEAKRGQAPYSSDTLLVVASTALRGEDDKQWEAKLQEVAPTSGRLAAVLVERALRAGEPAEDLLAVVVRAR